MGVRIEDEIIEELTTRPTLSTPPTRREFLSTGSTLLNLALSGRVDGGFVKGHYHFMVGDSKSGKTFLSLTCLAEAARNKYFNDYRFIYDNSENGALMNMEHFFGKKMASRLEAPSLLDGEPNYSATVQEFYYHLDDAVEKATPFIYILDSMDCLGSDSDVKKFRKQKKASRKPAKDEEKKVAGSYGDGKAKENSQGLRRVMPFLRRTGSILIIINQTRDNIPAPGTITFEKKTRAGGRALTFYATFEMWLSVKGPIKKRVLGKEREIGITSRIQVKKNRVTGRNRRVDVVLNHSHGIDDVGSCVQWLLEEGHWKKGNSGINAVELGQKLDYEALVKYVEENNQEKKLQEVVSTVWDRIDEGCQVQRKSRYV